MDGFCSHGDEWELGLALLLLFAGTIMSILCAGYGLQNTVLLILKRYPKYPVIIFWTIVFTAILISIMTRSGRGLVLFYLIAPVQLIIFRFGRLDQNKKQEQSNIKTEIP